MENLFLSGLAQAAPTTFFADPHGSSALWAKILIGLLLGIGIIVAFMFVPLRARRPIIATATFFAGLYWVLYYLWPQPYDKKPDDIPANSVESVGFWLADALPVVGDLSNIVTAFLLGLGIYSILRIHLTKVVKWQKDAVFSLLLIVSMLGMVIFGYMDWNARKGEAAAELSLQENWGVIQYVRDLLFDGLLQQMDAAMFSIIGFYILSAAYRAFRIRSVEATILLAAAFVMMLSLMGLVVHIWDTNFIENSLGGHAGSFLQNFKLTEVAAWLKANLETPGIRAIEFGIGIGALAMGLRLWLSLERGGVSS